MPDVLTHLATGHWAGRLGSCLVRSRATKDAFVVATILGVALPDLLTRVPALILDVANIGPSRLYTFFLPLHSPLPYVLFALLVSRAFARDIQRAVLAGLLVGGGLHMGFDLGQRALRSTYYLLFPFSAQDFHLDLFEPEASVDWAIGFVAASLALELALAGLRRGARRAGPAPPNHT